MSILLRNLPVSVGILTGSLIFINRLSTALVTPEQARSDALGLMASSVLVLVGLLWQQVQPPEPVETALAGEEVETLDEGYRSLAADFGLLKEALLKNTRARSLLVHYRGHTIYRAGFFELSSMYADGQIAARVMRTEKSVYLVDLRLFPGRLEFAYLPLGTRAVICEPLGDQGVLVVGAATVRGFSTQELAWIEALAAHLKSKIEPLR